MIDNRFIKVFRFTLNLPIQVTFEHFQLIFDLSFEQFDFILPIL